MRGEQKGTKEREKRKKKKPEGRGVLGLGLWFERIQGKRKKRQEGERIKIR